MGPIFLFIYLAAEPQQPTWLLWWGLGLTLLSVLIALYGTKIGANTLFHRYTEDDPDDPDVDDSDSLAGRLSQSHPYERWLQKHPCEGLRSSDRHR